jgi:exosome complex exonuclease RRP6
MSTSNDSRDEFLKDLMTSLSNASDISKTLPKGLDYSYHNSFPEFRSTNEETHEKLTKLTKRLLQFCKSNKMHTLHHKVDESDDDDDDETAQLSKDPYFYSQISDIVDELLARAEKKLQNHQLLLSTSTSSNLISTTPMITTTFSPNKSLLTKSQIIQQNLLEIEKPQLQFLFDIDNHRNTIFYPKLKRKFHSKIEYKPILLTTTITASSSASSEDHNNNDNEHEVSLSYYAHPYELELQSLQYPSSLLDPPPSKPSSSSSSFSSASSSSFPDPLRACQWIDTVSQLENMMKEWKTLQITELAIDLEHHAYHSFQGLTCLMQVSYSIILLFYFFNIFLFIYFFFGI